MKDQPNYELVDCLGYNRIVLGSKICLVHYYKCEGCGERVKSLSRQDSPFPCTFCDEIITLEPSYPE